MSPRRVFIVAAAAIALYAQAQSVEKKQEQWTFEPKPLKGDYQVYGGTLSEVQPPTPKDRKVAFKFTGPLAKDLFNQIGPDAKDSCGGGPDYRERNRGDLSCTYNKNDGYTCYFGLNVPTGKSTYGAIC
jgi:hypothetical protein